MNKEEMNNQSSLFCETDLNLSLFNKVLTIGTSFTVNRGGVGAVIELYSKYIPDFKYIESHRNGSVITKCFIYLKCISKTIYTLIFDKELEIVHIHGSSYGSFYRKFILFILTKYIFSKKVLYHMHGGEFILFYKRSNPVIKQFIQTFINNNDGLICLSNLGALNFKDLFSPKKVVVIPNMIDYPDISSGIIEHERNGITTFLFLGQITKNKGIFDLIEVIKRNKQNYEGVIELIIGGNGNVSYLNNFIKEFDLGNIIKFLGWLDHKSKIKVLRRSQIYILPSYYEGLPISILEAMSYGMPVISTSVGGIPEIVTHKKNGILLKPGNLEEIKNAIDFFILNPDSIKTFGKFSKDVIEKFYPESVLFNLQKIYMEILKNNIIKINTTT